MMKKKIIVGLMIFVCTMLALAIVAGCQNNQQDYTQLAPDPLGREYGQQYDIDSYDSGKYNISYNIEDTSDMGKMMIGQYCLEYVGLQVDDGKYELTFYCKSEMLKDVMLGDVKAQGEEVSQGYAYSFDITRDMLDDKMAMSCLVKLMNKQVEFSIRVDLQSAVLVG